jgi:branched-chain amino acid transport system substrate-binding protein
LRKRISVISIVLALAAGEAPAQENLKIGLIMPLTGNSAVAGQQGRAAIELGAEIVNGNYPDLAGSPLAGSAGLPNLKNARIQIVTANDQGNPAVGEKQTARLINEERVIAVQGSYPSSVTLAASTVAEQSRIPFMAGNSSAVNITTRGFKWIFRVTPHATDFAKSYMTFLTYLQHANHPISTIGIVYENTDYGTSTALSLREAARDAHLPITVDIPYDANATDVSSQVLQLKAKRPDAVIFASYTSDIIRYMKTFQNLNYRPPVVIGDDAGFSDPAFIANVGHIAQGVLDRSGWERGKPGSITARINDVFKTKTGYDLDDTSARNMQSFLVLAYAINRAGSTRPEAIQQALRETDLKPEQLMMGYHGVKFDPTGQNALAATYLMQLQGPRYVPVWPERSGGATLIYPFKGWQ